MDDLISRQQAIDALNKLSESTYEVDYGVVDCDDAINAIAALPPAEPKTGKWTNVVDGIEYTWGICDKCGAHIPMPYKYYEYCPHCGVKMQTEVDYE